MKKYKPYSIDPIDLIQDICSPCEILQLMIDNIDSWGTFKATEIGDVLSKQCYSFNSFHQPDSCVHLSKIIQYHVLSENNNYYYDPGAIILVEQHKGSDPKTGYQPMEVYKLDENYYVMNLLEALNVDDSQIDYDSEVSETETKPKDIECQIRKLLWNQNN